MRLSLLTPLDRWLAPAPRESRVGWLPGTRFAHRGLHGDGLPENSPSAFAAAMARGWGIECDVQKSSDDQAMVFHDFELDRLTGETGTLNTRSSLQLGAITLSGSADVIPSLRAVLEQVDGTVPILMKDMHS